MLNVTNLQPNGVPVLFIPGNAGSYRQVRPIAAEAASQFFHAYRKNESILQEGIRNLDFFTGKNEFYYDSDEQSTLMKISLRSMDRRY